MSTYKEIAKIAGVSLSTVSKALSGSAEISEKTRSSILRIANELGYFKSKNLRKLKYNKYESMNIALICPEIISVHYSSTLTAIKNIIEEKGDNVFVYVTDFNSEKAKNTINKLTVDGFIDGIILVDVFIKDFSTSIPTVAITFQDIVSVDSVGTSMVHLWYDMVAYLKNKGHKKIGFVGEFLTKFEEKHFRLAVSRHNLKTDENYIYICECNKRFEQIGNEAAYKIAKQSERPTAIIAAYAEIGIGLIHRLLKLGISVPDDISVLAGNNTLACEYSHIPITSFDLSDEEIAKNATDLLFDKIINKTDVIKHITLGYKVIERDSVKEIFKSEP